MGQTQRTFRFLRCAPEQIHQRSRSARLMHELRREDQSHQRSCRDSLYRLTPMQTIPRHHERGITLLESLVAIVVAALGILGILGVQMRTLTDTQTTVRRAQAIRLIEDLGERLKVHPNALGSLGSYVNNWGTALASSPGKDCRSALCTPAELVAYDLWAWRTLVRASLPATDVNIFLAAGETVPEDRRQLGVMISWRENERDNDTAYKNPISTSTDGGTVSCPADRTCHLQYIPVSARCAPYLMGGTPQYFCPGAKL